MELAGEEEAKSFVEFVENTKTEERKSASFDFTKQLDKEKRTQLHKLIKSFSKELNSETKQEANGESMMSVVRVTFTKGKGADNRRDRNFWPPGRPNFAQFVLFKENKDAHDVLSVISRFLKCKPKVFGTAGTKDKRGITTQLVTAFHVTAESLAALNSKLFSIRVGNFSYVDKALNLGDLQGNRFTLVIRGVEAEDEEINTALLSLKEKGFINYFGEQRFGVGVHRTHDIGRCLLKGEYDVAFRFIAFSKANAANSETQAAAAYYNETGDAEGTIKLLPRNAGMERQLFTVLQKLGPRSFLNAINTLPRNLRQMYLHGYQSYVWNRVVNERIAIYGSKPVVGDIVIIGPDEKEVELPTEDSGDVLEEETNTVEMVTFRTLFSVVLLTEN
eukprot:TRINITY_DN3704_c0_g1_i2.p1 TRINITY_DN3704_c0_g1~~TRINITY_DN3704_c0_g1_i2.p1  ORF type:complete len:390 (+),score=86.56 TRINITY_DN3704_c0_g1_i2:354-1523(+)